MWPAALTKWGTLNNNSLCGVQCLAALAMTGYFFFRTTSTSTALVALLGLLAAGSRGDGCWEGAGTAVLPWPRVQGKIGGDHLHPPPCCAHGRRSSCGMFVSCCCCRLGSSSFIIRLDWSFERCVQNHELVD